MKKVNGDLYYESVENHAGWCTVCGMFTIDSGVEPDARGYECPTCGTNSVMGAEQAVVEGQLEITNED